MTRKRILCASESISRITPFCCSVCSASRKGLFCPHKVGKGQLGGAGSARGCCPLGDRPKQLSCYIARATLMRGLRQAAPNRPCKGGLAMSHMQQTRPAGPREKLFAGPQCLSQGHGPRSSGRSTNSGNVSGRLVPRRKGDI